MNKKLPFKDILTLQAVIVVYTLSSIFSKLASTREPLSVSFCLFYLAQLFILGIYALLWQQMIKKFELSVAYANRSVALLWSLVWAVLIFRDPITWKNAAGVLLVIIGTFIINTEPPKEAANENAVPGAGK